MWHGRIFLPMSPSSTCASPTMLLVLQKSAALKDFLLFDALPGDVRTVTQKTIDKKKRFSAALVIPEGLHAVSGDTP